MKRYKFVRKKKREGRGARHLLKRKVSVKKFRKLERQIKDYRFSVRSRIIILASKDYEIYEIAVLIGVSQNTVRFWIHRFNESGYKGLLDKPRSGRKRKVEYSRILEILVSPPSDFEVKQEFWTVKALYRVIQEKFPGSYSKKYIYQLIRRLGFVLKKPRPRHYKANPEAAAEVKRQIRELVHAGYPVYFEDETRVFLTTIIGRVIARKGEKIEMKVNIGHHKGIFIFGAINVSTRRVKIMFSEKFNSEAMMRFLYAVKREVGRGRVYVVLDNASSHKARRVEYLSRRKGIHFVFLPPYSPQLNPVEEIWRELKKYLENKLFKEVSEIKEEVEKFFVERSYKMEFEISNYFSD